MQLAQELHPLPSLFHWSYPSKLAVHCMRVSIIAHLNWLDVAGLLGPDEDIEKLVDSGLDFCPRRPWQVLKKIQKSSFTRPATDFDLKVPGVGA